MVDNDPIVNIQTPEEFNNEQHSTTGQQALTIAEGGAQGQLGPLATAAEAGLTKLGVPGLSPHDQEMRARANPVERYGSEAGSFAIGSLYGVGEARAVGELGNLAGKAIEGSSLASRLASSGVKAGAELSALQSGSELSKMINQDPNQTIGSAAINVGLAGLLGSTAGAGLGIVSEAFKGAAGKTEQLINDMKERTAFRQALENGEHISTDVSESAQRDAEGHTLADWAFDHGRKILDGTLGESVGAGLGMITGHPLIGSYVGRKVLTPLMESIVKPMVENATNAEGLKGTVDYLANAIKGNQVMDNAVKGLVSGSEVLPKNLLSSDESRKKLQSSIAGINSPEDAMQIGGQVGHYLPQHQTALGALIAQTKGALDAQKPPTQASSPWTGTTPLTPLQEAKYNRLLDIANQPLTVVKLAQNGTLTSKDVSDLNQIYPGVAKALTSKISSAIIEAKSKGQEIPYRTRVSMSLLTGNPLDASQHPQQLLMNMQSQGAQQQMNKVAGGKSLKGGHTTAAQLKQIDMTNKLASTRTQSREAAEALGKA